MQYGQKFSELIGGNIFIGNMLSTFLEHGGRDNSLECTERDVIGGRRRCYSCNKSLCMV